MLGIINGFIWGIVTALVVLIGLYYSNLLSFPQFNLKKIFKSLKDNDKKEINAIKTLYLTLAGRIGVGSIAGVALAIYLGGPGTIFWMWVMAFISGALTFAETMMAIKYKVSNHGEDFGGPSYYIFNGLNNKYLAIAYSLIVIGAYLFGFIPIQSNTIIKSSNMFFANKLYIGLFLSFITFVIIKGGVYKIVKVTNVLVPFMSVIYIFLTLIVVLYNFSDFLDILVLIVKSAFDIKSFFGGFIINILIGFQRGIFSNESGIGLGAIAASSSNSNNGCRSGYIQVLGIYITTILICSATAFIILMFDYKSVLIDNPNGIELTSLAFNYHFGDFGNMLLTIFVLLFSFTTILTGYYYCESSLRFLCKNRFIKSLKFFVPLCVLFGALCSPNFIWQLIDLVVGILFIINIYSLYKLRYEAFKYYQKYDRI